jgi:predicted Zn-dependent protease
MSEESSKRWLTSVQTSDEPQRIGVLALIRRAARLWPIGLVALVIVVGGWAIRQRRKPTGSADEIWVQAQRDLDEGNYSRAEWALNQIGRMRAPTPLDMFLRAQLAGRQDRPEEALANLARIPDSHSLASRARMLAGQIERKRDRARFAETAFLAALAIDPSLVQAHRELIYIYGMQLRRAELGREFLALKKLKALTFKNAFHWCLLRNNSWEPREAIADLSRYVAADPLDRWSRLALAENYRRMGLDAEAESALASLTPDDSQANRLRIEVALDRRDNDQADELLARGADRDPELARLRGRRALAERDGQSAARYFRVAMAADPSNRDTIFGLLSAYELLGNQKEAEPMRALARNLDRLNSLVLQAAKPTAAGNAALMRDLGTACAALHRDEEARAWFELAIARDPLDSSAQQALFRLGRSGDGERAVISGAAERPAPGNSSAR